MVCYKTNFKCIFQVPTNINYRLKKQDNTRNVYKNVIIIVVCNLTFVLINVNFVLLLSFVKRSLTKCIVYRYTRFLLY